jgi:hypothetical protein
MPRWTRTFQANFTKGQLNESAWDRLDTKIYAAGARNMLNAALVSQGGFKRRPGTTLRDALPSAPPVRLGGLFYSPTEQYLLMFEVGKVRIYDSISEAFIVDLATPYTAAQLQSLYFISVEGVFFICHEQVWPYQIIRQYQNNFTIGPYAFETSATSGVPGHTFQPFYKFAAEPMLITPSAVGPGAITLQTNGPYWSTLHANHGADGNPIRVRLTYPADPVAGTTTKIFEATINSVTNNQQIAVTLQGTTALPDLNPIVTWDEQMCSPVWGYFRSCGFQDQRLFFGGHPAAPGYLTGSQIGAPHNFDTGTGTDDEAIAIVVATESSNQIRGMISGLHFILMTSQGPFFFPNSSTNPLTPSNCGFRRTAGQQCGWVKPVVYDTAAVYPQRRGDHLREMVFDLYRQAYTTAAITLLSNDLINEPIELHVIPADDQNPDTYLFCLNSDGNAAVYLGDRDQEIGGWVLWDTSGGNIISAAEVGEFFWMAVTRTLNGVAVTSLERLDWTQILDASSTFTSATPTTTWTGLTRYANTAVDVMGDGYSMGTYTVDGGGTLTLPGQFPCKTLTVGFDFQVSWETLPIDGALNDGPVQGRPYQIASSVIKLIGTDNITVNGMRLWARQPFNPSEATAPLYSGPHEIYIQDWNRTQTIKLGQANPGACQVTAVSVELAIS